MTSRAARYREFVRQSPYRRDSTRVSSSDWSHLSKVDDERWHQSEDTDSIRRAIDFLTGLETFAMQNPESDIVVFSNRLTILDSILYDYFNTERNAEYDEVLLGVVAVDTRRGTIIPLTARALLSYSKVPPHAHVEVSENVLSFHDLGITIEVHNNPCIEIPESRARLLLSLQQCRNKDRALACDVAMTAYSVRNKDMCKVQARLTNGSRVCAMIDPKASVFLRVEPRH